MIAAMILAAGKGTRLAPLTDRLAKPMVPIGDRPAIAHVAERVRLAASRIVVNLYHRPEDVAAWAAPRGIALSREGELLGTAGGVAGAAALLGEGDVLVWNADIFCALDPGELVAAHAHARAAATLAVRPRPSGEGNVGIANGGRVVRLRGERVDDVAEESGGDFLGIHVIGAELREACPERGCLVGDVYLPALHRGVRVEAFVTSVPFVDVGTLAQYLAANRAWLASRGLASWAAPDARVNAPIDGSVVGAGALVDAPTLRSVVWPGAHVCEGAEDTVIP